AFAFILVSKAASGARGVLPATQSTSTPVTSILIQQPPITGSPTPALQPYDIGVWLSSMSPTGGWVKVFVRINHVASPVANVPVTLSVGGAVTSVYGPQPTNADG